MVQMYSYQLFFLLVISRTSLTQRRIKDGFEVQTTKQYVVYFLGDTTSPNYYQGWTCGGAIISPDYILTSAACVQDVQHIFAVAGYKKYVPADRMDEDNCVKEKKKKVILICVPRGYLLDYNRTDEWAKVDIAVVKVESPYDFTDKSYETVCHYMPQAIEFNLDINYPKDEEDLIVLGWGHTKMFRKDTDLLDLNQAALYYAPVKLMNITICTEYFSGNKRLYKLIGKTMLCTSDPGNLSEKGELLTKARIMAGCINKQEMLRGAVGPMCQDDEEGDQIYDGDRGEMPDVYGDEAIVYDMNNGRKSQIKKSRKQNFDDFSQLYIRNDDATQEIPTVASDINQDAPDKIDTPDTSDTPDIPDTPENNDGGADVILTDDRQDKGGTEDIIIIDRAEEITTDVPIGPTMEDLGGAVEDTPGFCQNDHGGPLVAWRGGKEILVAVATLFKLDIKYRCRGPYLYTKTSCNGAFIKCIVDQKAPDSLLEGKDPANKPEKPDDTTRRRCDVPEEIGFEILRRHISWVGHRDGPAENERIQLRHQVPMSAFQPIYPRPRKTTTNISVPLSNYRQVH